MAESKRIVALVPMRHASERVPGKNYRELAGKPLFHHIMDCLLACEEISQVVVNTDSAPTKKGLEEHFPQVAVMDRPEDLRGGAVPMNAILLHDVEHVSADIYLQTHSTNPLLRPQTVSEAIQAFLKAQPEHDSLFSVTELHTRLYDREGQALNHNPEELLRTQDLPPVYEENSCIYIFTRQALLEHQHRVGSNPLLFPIPAQEALDIDEELDFQLAEYFLRQRAAQ